MPDVINLTPLYNAIGEVSHQVGVVGHNLQVVGNQVEAVANQQADTRQRLEQLYQEFQEYVDKDFWANEVSTARQEITLARQELESKFGHYDEVRRQARGILQATDLAIVRKETVHTEAEKIMISCPGYWLAPGVVSLSAWISDDQPLAERALAEALKRDDSKVSLFFGLVCRRARRSDALGRWLVRYFQNQNPAAMDREVVVMLDALANGVFGGAALAACSAVIDEWLAFLEEQAGFPAEQRKRWSEALDLMTPPVPANEYPTLRTYSPTWPKLEASLAAARRNPAINSFFDQLFTGEIVVSPVLEESVDQLLQSLVENFDDEELPLRRKERSNQIVVEVDQLPLRPADKRREVERRVAGEAESLKEQTNFAALLTQSAMHPEQSKASRATQRYAVSRSREWILAGFNDLVARDRARVPVDVEIAAGSWKGTSRDGSNEQQLSSDLYQHYSNRIEEAVNAVKITGATWAITIIAALIGLAFIKSVGVLFLAGAGIYFFFQYRNLDNRRQQVRQQLEKERDDADRILKAALAELADLRREIAVEDAKANGVLTFLNALSSPEFILKRPEQARAVIA